MKKFARVMISLLLAVMLMIPALPAAVSAGRVASCPGSGSNRIDYGKALYYAYNGSWPDGANRATETYLYTDPNKPLFASTYFGNAVLEVDICPLNTNASIVNNVSLNPNGGFIEFDLANGKIGVNGTTTNLNFAWRVGEWHHVTIFSVFGTAGSAIFVDGVSLSYNVVLGSSAVLGRSWISNVTNCGIDNIKIYEGVANSNSRTNNLLYSENFNDGNWDKASSDCLGKILSLSSALGTYYWKYQGSNNYAAWSEYGIANNYSRWEFDVMVPGNGTISTTQESFGGPVFNCGSIGTGSLTGGAATTIAYSWDGDWHHVVMESQQGKGTAIFVDNEYLGLVANSLKGYWRGTPGDGVCFDNVKLVGDDGRTYIEDFEDGVYQKVNKADDTGSVTEYTGGSSHNWDAGVTTTAVTCTTDGVITYTCSTCGTTRTETVTAPGHNFGAWTTVTAPTETTPGLKRRSCQVCGLVQEESIAPRITPKMTVSTAYAERGTTTTVSVTLANNPGIYAQNFVIYYSDKLTLNSATASGDVYPAGNASSSSNLSITPSANTTINSYFTAAGVSTSGVKAFTWYVDNGGGFTNATANGTILTLSFTLPSSGTEQEYLVGIFGIYAPTDDAVTADAESLPVGVSYTNGKVVVGTAHTHTWDDGAVTTPATCAAAGVMTYTCTVCGETRTEAIAKTTTHTWNTGEVTTPATCAAAGVMTYTCTVCGTTRTEAIAKTTTHTWDEGVVTTEPTATTPGVRTYTCTVCGATRTEEIDPIPVTAKIGDVDGDGAITIKDISALKAYIAGTLSATDIVGANSDIDEDGVINMMDISALKVLIAG
ncbi:MAG: hypothetical protein IKN38_08935 [Clostridia bacterium]|nr:hypothetical protein [Clostridia bacterium]